MVDSLQKCPQLSTPPYFYVLNSDLSGLPISISLPLEFGLVVQLALANWIQKK